MTHLHVSIPILCTGSAGIPALHYRKKKIISIKTINYINFFFINSLKITLSPQKILLIKYFIRLLESSRKRQLENKDQTMSFHPKF